MPYFSSGFCKLPRDTQALVLTKEIDMLGDATFGSKAASPRLFVVFSLALVYAHPSNPVNYCVTIGSDRNAAPRVRMGDDGAGKWRSSVRRV